MSDCLIELGTEELPPKALLKLSTAFSEGVVRGLQNAGIRAQAVESFATPRRLAILLRDIPLKQQDQLVEKRGPALQAAFDAAGNPSKAAQGFARSCGVEVSALIQKQTDKGSWLYFEEKQQGQTLQALLPPVVSEALAQLPIPKRMRWGDRADEFVRPVHWLLMLLDDQLIPATILGTDAGTQTFGHRFHAPAAITLQQAADYEQRLGDSAYVVASFERRRDIIRQQLIDKAAELGGVVKMDQDLLDEVTALVEWPVAISGQFDQAFLAVPVEALVTTMQDNQKYFAVFSADGQLLPYFITIANIDSKKPELVARGNERVIRPRFADAKFFWEQDQKVTLSSRLQSLETVVFQQQLGSISDKVIRIRALAGTLAESLGADVTAAERAAELCKCDLMTNMVGEFPKLQGIMGNYYARLDGESDAVANAIQQHYWPRFAGDQVPTEISGQCVALADRIDTMLGIFAIGQKPSGVKDPFGLRRAALGIIRIMIENNLAVDLQALCQQAASGLADKLDASPVVEEVVDYIYDRLKAYYQDQQIRLDVVDAVLVCRPTLLTDLHQRVLAVSEFLQNDAALALAAANKRISNILKKQEQSVTTEIDANLLLEPAEKNLYRQLSDIQPAVQQHFNSGEYLPGLNALAALRPVVDQFFDDVMVMAEDEKLRMNRLALLQKLANNFLQAADFSRIQ
ncbi:MAG: glycine--tRNA ligase subunit beta [Gammaproteobacteria bacterium]|nr:glycine--tRNA ligase subunit beta [Gammaproteobacteria bacterium]MBL6999029.1 glycine--tRNA ligase subunit beta [Gammaproteobacteria bacterium]